VQYRVRTARNKILLWFSSFRTDGNPPMLCLRIGPRASGDASKDTLDNIEETGEFVVNIVSLSLSNTMFESSKNHLPEADEFEKADLTPAPCEVVGAPRVEEAGVSMESVLDRVLLLGFDHLVIGRVARFRIEDELYGAGRIDAVGLDPLGRLAGNYTKVETIFELPTEDFQRSVGKATRPAKVPLVRADNHLVSTKKHSNAGRYARHRHQKAMLPWVAVIFAPVFAFPVFLLAFVVPDPVKLGSITG
jgi:flavin reductase (DIM6/NTAB) family NADH-FMN oxidoreductase RutF